MKCLDIDGNLIGEKELKYDGYFVDDDDDLWVYQQDGDWIMIGPKKENEDLIQQIKQGNK